MEIKQSYKQNGMEMEISMKAECSTKEALNETLHFIAQKSHEFYLKAGNEINSKLS